MEVAIMIGFLVFLDTVLMKCYPPQYKSGWGIIPLQPLFKYLFEGLVISDNRNFQGFLELSILQMYDISTSCERRI
jgi:hypothetical protein